MKETQRTAAGWPWLPRARARGGRALLASLALGASLAGAGAAGWRAARGADPDPQPFVGTWLCGPDSTLSAPSCGLQDSLDGATLAIGRAPGAASPAELVLDIGCRCRLPLAISADDPTLAALVAPTACEIVFRGYALTTTVEGLSVRLGDQGQVLDLDLRTGPTHAPMLPDCASASMVARLRPQSPVAADCGPDETAVGLIPFAAKGTMDCPLGAGRDGLTIELHDEEDTTCWSQSGARGEPAWALPQASKYDVDSLCRPRGPSPQPQTTYLPFCRVDGRRFKPLTADPTAVEQFYAVLKMSGDGQPCPDGSIEMVSRIDTEDDPPYEANLAIGRLGPNQVGDKMNITSASLHFCYFRWAASPEQTMDEFPDVGFPYAVFHDFEGPQPLWVSLKRWVYSSNERSNNSNGSSAPSGDEQALQAFQRLVGSAANATTFDMARVR